MRANLQKRLDRARSQIRNADFDAFMKLMGQAFHFTAPPASLGVADKMVPWLFREFARNPKINPERVLPIRDWWVANRIDLGRISFNEADKAQQAWHKQLAEEQKKAEIAITFRGALVLAFKDGAAWYRVTAQTTDPKIKKSLRAAGASLGHCYAKAVVLNAYLQYNSFYVLYGRDGEPHVTIAAGDQGQIVDAKITGDVAIPPDCRWVPHVVALIETGVLLWFHLMHLAPATVLARLADDPNVLVRRDVANDAGTPPTILGKLADDPDVKVRRGIVSNINTPPTILSKLADDPVAEVRWYIANNINTPPAILGKLAEDLDVEVRWQIASNINTPPTILEKLAGDPVTLVRRGVARNISTPPAILRKLTGDPDTVVRWHGASNVNTPTAILEKLAGDPVAEVRWHVARNSRTPTAILEKLADDPNMLVRRFVARNSRVPLMTLRKLAGDHAAEVRETAIQTMNTLRCPQR